MSEDRGEQEAKGFKVNDKRRFEPDGREKEDAPPEASRGSAAGAAGDQDLPRANADGPLPEIDFTTFVLSLVTSVMISLGESEHPEGGRKKDLPMAKQTIDILGMLRDKTQGNLTKEEKKLLDEVLYDLRLRFVAASQ